MIGRKDEIAWLEETLREIERRNSQCAHCRIWPAKDETGLCDQCELFATYERALAGEDTESA